MSNKFCQYCGNSIGENENFCQSCGKPQSTQPTPVQRPQAQQGAYYQAPQQPVYTPVQAPPVVNDPPLSVGQYLLMIIVAGIPIVGLILLLVWAFGGDVNKNKKNYAIALLIMSLISIVLSIIFSALLIPLIYGVISGISESFMCIF